MSGDSDNTSSDMSDDSRCLDWKLFDFDENWAAFRVAWEDERVQLELDDAMDDWCNGNYHGTPWKRGDPLYKFSRTDFWAREIDEAASEFVDSQPGAFREYTSLMARKGFHHVTDYYDFECSDLEHRISNEELRQIERKFGPAPDSLESLIVIMGKNYLVEPFARCARIMFPTSGVQVTEDDTGNNHIWVEDEHIYFDIYDFFFSTRSNHPHTPFLSTAAGKCHLIEMLVGDAPFRRIS